ncbi:hypothetical protein [Rhizorhabdus dicambivorans]|uniref:Uncharacterized protein n=1 Tax=Rhizorhabdus dicambivorans TaxID=1850238 RepID=A0A2A4FS10_9SPHN|nr:hypothetical protein [Rhizorhabdus dicambivorans]ATE65626.1 hypothetical protein CMV14_15450 [Rhizorhabdus dicambivorans]PCE40967.1 hypothetical protein COO09_17360 [Rhizorhabdus dicambivorans]
MFKLVLAIALAAGSAAAAQAIPVAKDRPSQPEQVLTAKAPRQIAGPVKIRVRQHGTATLGLTNAPAQNAQLAYRQPATLSPLD